MSSPISKQRNAIRQSIKKLCLSTAIVSAISAPSIAQQVIADGTDETVAPGTVINTGTTNGGNGSGLVAKNNGTIRADGPVTITTGGYGAIGVAAYNNGHIDLTDATITTSGAVAPGISVNGAGSSIVATDTHVSTSGLYSPGVAVINRGTYTQNGGSITTTGNSASGYQVESGGTAEITDVDVKTSGTGSHGVGVAGNGSVLRMEGGRISTVGAGSHGAFAFGAGTLVDLIGTTVVTNGNAAYGLAAQSGGEVNAVDVDVTTHGVGSHGVFAAGGGQVSVDGSTISTTGDESYGAYSSGVGSDISIANSTIRTEGYYGATGASDGGHISISGSRIYTTGVYGHGLEATRNSSAEIENSIIETWGDTAHGLSASAASEIKARNVIITTYRPRAHAVWAGGGGHVVVDSAIINTSGYDSSGLFTAGGTIDANNVDVTSSGSNAGPVKAYTGTINLSNSRVTTDASSGLVAFLSGTVNATNVEVNLRGPTTAGAQASHGGTINLDRVSITGTNGNVGISTIYGGTVIGTNVAIDVGSSGGNKAVGLTMTGGNLDHLIDLTSSSVVVGGEGATGLVVATGGQGTLRLTNSALEVKDGTAIAVYGSNLDADLDGSSVIGRQLLNVSDYAGTDARAINIRATNGSYLEGDVHVGAGDAQHAAISLDQGSVLKGATDGLHELNVANNSIWQVTGDSNVDTLLNDNGTVAFGPDGAFKTLTVGSLDSRNGSFLFNTKLNEGGAATETDKLAVAGDATGDGKFFIANKGGQGAVTGTGATDGIKLTDIAGSSDAEFELGSAAIVGIYDYKLVKADGQNWYLQTEGKDPVIDPPACTPGVDCPIDPPSGHIVDIVPGYNIALAAAQEHVLTTLDTFHERVGELRSQEMEDGFHAWTRGIGKSGSYSPKISGYNGGGFDLDTAGMQIGGDYSVGGVVVPGDKLTFGVFGEFAHSSFDVDGRTAHGSISSKGIGGYVTWQQNAPSERKPGTGAYVDVVAKHDWMDFGVRARSISDFELRHGYKGKANTASIETGYGFGLGNDVVLQPQAQLTWSKVTAGGFTDGYGIAVHGQKAESLVGRLGVRLEKTWYLDEEETAAPAPVEPQKSVKGRKGKGKAVAVARPEPRKKKKFVKSVTGFVDANVKHEFKGNSGLVASGTPIGADMGGTRFDIGVGAVAKVSENVGIYGRAAVEFGGPSDVAAKVTAGLKITW